MRYTCLQIVLERLNQVELDELTVVGVRHTQERKEMGNSD